VAFWGIYNDAENKKQSIFPKNVIPIIHLILKKVNNFFKRIAFYMERQTKRKDNKQ
jgi:hypothetical protein